MVKHTQTIRWQQSANCLSVFDHFVGLALKGLTWCLTANAAWCSSKRNNFTGCIIVTFSVPLFRLNYKDFVLLKKLFWICQHLIKYGADDFEFSAFLHLRFCEISHGNTGFNWKRDTICFHLCFVNCILYDVLWGKIYLILFFFSSWYFWLIVATSFEGNLVHLEIFWVKVLLQQFNKERQQKAFPQYRNVY